MFESRYACGSSIRKMKIINPHGPMQPSSGGLPPLIYQSVPFWVSVGLIYREISNGVEFMQRDSTLTSTVLPKDPMISATDDKIKTPIAASTTPAINTAMMSLWLLWLWGWWRWV